MQNYVYNYHSEMRLPEDKGSSKSKKSYAICNQEVGEEGEEENNHHQREEDSFDSAISDSVMAINGKSSSIKIFSKEQLAFDKNFANKVNSNCKTRTPEKMHKCPCGILPQHSTKFGSIRFCEHYLDIKDFKARKQFIKTHRLCTNCLRKDHSTVSCRMRVLSCFYCKEAGKVNSNHNAKLMHQFLG